MYVGGFRKLFDFEGYVIEKVRLTEELAQVNLRRDRRFNLTCPHCGAKMGKNRTSRQTARDLPLGPVRKVILVYEAIQGRCSSCDRFATIRPPGIPEGGRATWRLMSLVSCCARFMPLSRISEILPVSTATAYRWDKKVLTEELPEPNLDELEVLLIDEKSIGKHHDYVTVVLDGQTGELLHMAEGKKKKSLESFFDRLTDEQKCATEAAAMDRAGAYKEVVSEEIPEADIVFDKFHIIKNYHDVIDEVRRQEWRAASDENKEVVKGQRYNLFRNPENLTEEQGQELEELLQLNENINKVYVMKDKLRKLWGYVRPDRAERYLEHWAQLAKQSTLEPLEEFGSSLLECTEEVVNYFRHEITLGPLEGFNNLISRILHRACGYDDLEYMFLKLRRESLPKFLISSPQF